MATCFLGSLEEGVFRFGFLACGGKGMIQFFAFFSRFVRCFLEREASANQLLECGEIEGQAGIGLQPFQYIALRAISKEGTGFLESSVNVFIRL
jgi:hypothetical protein